MSTERQYNLRVARDLLGVDGNTLRDWIEKHQVELISSDADKRIKFISHASLILLAKQHGKTIATQVNRDSSRIALEQRVTALEEAIEKVLNEVVLLRSERRSRPIEKTSSSEERHPFESSLEEKEPPAFRPPTYTVTGNQLSEYGMGRIAFAHGSANSEEYGRKYVAKKIPGTERTSVIAVLAWLKANRPFNECVIDPTCACHTMGKIEASVLVEEETV